MEGQKCRIFRKGGWGGGREELFRIVEEQISKRGLEMSYAAPPPHKRFDHGF